MIHVQVRDNTPEEFEKAMKVFKKKCNNDGFLQEVRERRYALKPSVKRKLKRIKNKRRK